MPYRIIYFKSLFSRVYKRVYCIELYNAVRSCERPVIAWNVNSTYSIMILSFLPLVYTLQYT